MDCTFKNEFGKKQTGYLSRSKLIGFLKARFGHDKEFAAQVGLGRMFELTLVLIDF